MSALPETKPHPGHKAETINLIVKSDKSEFIIWLKEHEGWTITHRLIQIAQDEL